MAMWVGGSKPPVPEVAEARQAELAQQAEQQHRAHEAREAAREHGVLPWWKRLFRRRPTG